MRKSTETHLYIYAHAYTVLLPKYESHKESWTYVHVCSKQCWKLLFFLCNVDRPPDFGGSCRTQEATRDLVELLQVAAELGIVLVRVGEIAYVVGSVLDLKGVGGVLLPGLGSDHDVSGSGGGAL